MSTKRAVVVGFDYYAKFLADLMNTETPDWRVRAYDGSRVGTLRAVLALRTADALISFGGPAPNAALIEAARRRNIPVFVVWAGSDVLKAQEDPFGLEVIKQEEFIHLSDARWLVDELRLLGISGEYLPLTAIRRGSDVKPFPSEFRVLTYLPEPRRNFYGAELVYHVARAMPDVPFTVVGAGGRDQRAPENVHFVGMVNDMENRIDAATVLLRLPEHDGKSMLVLEALSRARHVVWNYEFPGVQTAKTEAAVLVALANLRRLHESSALRLNHEGREFVLRDFERGPIALRFARRLDEGANQWRARAVRARRSVAISGLGLFCAEVVEYGKLYAPQWNARVLRTASRLDVLTSIWTLAGCDVWYSIGGPTADRWLWTAARLMRKPRVVHWVGSDIASASENASLREMLSGTDTTHLAEVDWTAQQLSDLGFRPQIAPLPPRHSAGVPGSMPEAFTVMLYVPRTRSDFYGRAEFERLAYVLKDKPVRYVIVGGGDIAMPKGVDAENLGWRDSLTDVYERVSLLIRLTPRDGLSLMVLEALSFGRRVFWTQRFPYTQVVNGFEEMKSSIESLLDLHLRGELRPNIEASQMVANQYSPRKCIVRIAAAWEQTAEQPRARPLAVELP
ncbi:MAG: hypothetical protein ABR508_04040 [Candidatus Baltobacteraceae bacterium]